MNFHESSILGLHISESQPQSSASSLLCHSAKLPFVYLGLPIGGNGNRLEMWDPIINRLNKKLASWKGTLLSIGGRATFIKASLSNLPIYYMSLFPISKGVINKIVQIQRQFLWCNYYGKKSIPLVSWDNWWTSENPWGLKHWQFIQEKLCSPITVDLEISYWTTGSLESSHPVEIWILQCLLSTRPLYSKTWWSMEGSLFIYSSSPFGKNTNFL